MLRCQHPYLKTALAVALLMAGCQRDETQGLSMDQIAETFVKLVLALGQHDADYVDAYMGPEAWRHEIENQSLGLAEIRQQASAALAGLRQLPATDDKMEDRRRASLDKTLLALIARVDLLAGERMSFDEESQALYDALAPSHSTEHFQEIVDRLTAAVPGEGTLSERYESFKRDFIIPPERLDAVFRAAVDACRRRTRQFLDLPEQESFEIEYVTDKSWSGYNWYKGNYHSLIQVNTDLPIYIDRALDLACHEGYPGHHVYNLLIERDLLKGRGWQEFSIYPLFSPRSLIAEGTANFGIEVAFPAEQRITFERETLFPLAGLDSDRVEEYYQVHEMARELGFAGNEAARRYLDGDFDAEAAIDWLTRYSLMPRARAEQRLRFIEQYRAYVINYNLGQELVRTYVEGLGGTANRPAERWRIFADLLSRPYLPSELG